MAFRNERTPRYLGKPNFLWMMYRSGWGIKDGQEVTLAVWLRRAAFEAILREAVPSSFAPEVYASYEDWQAAVARSSVRLQWDPDHDAYGSPLMRRAIQLGLRGDALARYVRLRVSPLLLAGHTLIAS